MRHMGSWKIPAVLAIIMLLLLLGFTASAESSGTCGDHLTWTLDDAGQLTISGTGRMYNYDYNGCPWGSDITAAVLNEGVTHIGDYAFYNCSEMTRVTIPSSVTSIGFWSFAFCGKLTGIALPPSVNTIASYAFRGCSNLTDFTIPSGVTNIESRVFWGCSGLKSVTIPSGVTSIWGSAFQDCSALTSVTIPSGVTSISSQAFGGCSALTRVTIPSSVTSIGQSAFAGCTALTSVTIPSSVTDLGIRVFEGCSALTSVTIPSGVTSIGEYMFGRCSALTSVSIPSGVTSIGEGAFSGCSALTSVTIPFGVTSIGTSAFRSCIGLEEITIPSSVTSIGQGAFRACIGLTSITIPSSVTSISSSTFASCNGLTSITIPSSVTSIGDSAFEYCNALTSVSLPYGVISIGEYAFQHCGGLTSVTIPSSATSIGKFAFSDCAELTDVTIPYGVTSIGDFAFHQCWKLTNVTIPSSVVSIGSYSFQSTALTSLTIPSSVTSIGDYAFFQCWWLTDLTISPSVTSIGSYTFATCSRLTSVTIPSGVTSLGEHAFFQCSELTSVTIPLSVTAIGDSAFYRCQNLQSVHYAGSAADKEQISIASNNEPLINVSWHYGLATYYTVSFDANGGSVGTASITVMNGETYGDLPVATRTSYRFDGWFTSASGGTQITGSTTVSLTADQTLYAHWTYIPESYTISYDANGGTGTPSPQTKEKNVSLTLSSIAPSKNYIIQYNANGGSVSPASKGVSCTFNNWNTATDGSGTAYVPGSSYTANADATLYAQWTNPTAGTLATPSRSGYDFDGWFTSVTGGTQIKASSTVTGSTTVYAHWTVSPTDPYNLGDETYSFANYSDSDSFGGHCFGMSVTSAGYHIGSLSISKIGGNANTPLYGFSRTATVKAPICYYQAIQGSYSKRAIVAGGSYYLDGYYNITRDWNEVVSYVRNHTYDDTGLLQIGYRKRDKGGHAINFLRYESVSGQDRIYAYDNNFPTMETYFYLDSTGNVRQAPVQTFSGAIDCITLRNCRTYFNNVGGFDSSHALYMAKNAATVQGYTCSYIETDLADEEYVMYEIPANQDRVIIIPSRDYADFIYMDTEYSFGEITDDTYGELRFASLDEGAIVSVATFRILHGDTVLGEPDFTLPTSLTAIDASAFEGIAATIVYVPDTCLSIGAYAFRNSAVQKIRIPAECTIATTAFDGCESVRIFGTAGSNAEAFCKTHDNCIFVVE